MTGRPRFEFWPVSDEGKVRAVLDAMLTHVFEHDPQRWDEVLKACADPNYRGMECRPFGDGEIVVLVGEVPIGTFNIAAIAREDLSPN